MSAPLVLFVDLKPNTRLDLRVAARASLAWADMVDEIGFHYDPRNSIAIELEDAHPGSQKIRALVRSLVGDPKSAIRTAVISALIFLAKDTATWGWEKVLEWMTGPDAPPEVQTLSKKEQEEIAKECVKAIEGKIGKDTAQKVYKELANDENVSGAAMSSSVDRRPEIVIPLIDFPTLYEPLPEKPEQTRVRNEEAQLVLLKPVLTRETNKRWGFAWPHGKIGATIKDHQFLNRMASGRLNIPMSEGIIFTVDLEIQEEQAYGVWAPKEYNVIKVLYIEPPRRQDGFDLEISEGD